MKWKHVHQYFRNWSLISEDETIVPRPYLFQHHSSNTVVCKWSDYSVIIQKPTFGSTVDIFIKISAEFNLNLDVYIWVSKTTPETFFISFYTDRGHNAYKEATVLAHQFKQKTFILCVDLASFWTLWLHLTQSSKSLNVVKVGVWRAAVEKFHPHFKFKLMLELLRHHIVLEQPENCNASPEKIFRVLLNMKKSIFYWTRQKIVSKVKSQPTLK